MGTASEDDLPVNNKVKHLGLFGVFLEGSFSEIHALLKFI